MRVFAWLTISISMFFLFIIMTIPYNFLSIPAFAGWSMCLAWIWSWATAFDKAEKTEDLLQKARTQNNEFTNDLVETLKKQAEEIKSLYAERTALIVALEDFVKGKINGKN